MSIQELKHGGTAKVSSIITIGIGYEVRASILDNITGGARAMVAGVFLLRPLQGEYGAIIKKVENDISKQLVNK